MVSVRKRLHRDGNFNLLVKIENIEIEGFNEFINCFGAYFKIHTNNLYKEIISGEKKDEWRNNKEYWRKRLLGDKAPTKAWFVIGYPKDSLPRLEADITDIIIHEEIGQIQVKFTNVVEVKSHSRS